MTVLTYLYEQCVCVCMCVCVCVCDSTDTYQTCYQNASKSFKHGTHPVVQKDIREREREREREKEREKGVIYFQTPVTLTNFAIHK